ncbi:TPA: response regulator [Candidatus Micrarchaeota archaeon]|nr:response regulator [Candidatus Micrarchaeota archaeon]
MRGEEYLAGKKILVVDDEVDVLEALEELLSMCQVEKAQSFKQAEELLESRDFDLAVLDIMGVDGYRLLELARKKGITTVMLTAHAFSPEDLVRSIKEGADSYLPKEELENIADFLVDVIKAKEEERSPWEPWAEKLPSSYFEKRWGAAWKDREQEFWSLFRESIRAKRSSFKKE